MVDEYAAVVGHDHFLEESPQGLPHAVDGLTVVEAAGGEKLREQISGTLYGSGDELGEEGHEGIESGCVARGFDFFAVDVDGVGQRLEGVERYADGQHQIECDPSEVYAHGGEDRAEVGGEEVVVFVCAEDAEADGYVRPADPSLRPPPPAKVFEQESADEGCGGCQDDKSQKAPVPPAVEDVAGCDDEHVLPSQGLEHEPVEQEYYRQEEQEFYRVEKHGAFLRV